MMLSMQSTASAAQAMANTMFVFCISVIPPAKLRKVAGNTKQIAICFTPLLPTFMSNGADFYAI